MPTQTERHRQGPTGMLPHLPLSFSQTTCKAAVGIPALGLQSGAEQDSALPFIHNPDSRQSRTHMKQINTKKSNPKELEPSVGGGKRGAGGSMLEELHDSPEIERNGNSLQKEQQSCGSQRHALRDSYLMKKKAKPAAAAKMEKLDSARAEITELPST